ncbi:MAG: hypothetical protein FXF54_02765 [Kosmotoga sp.]|nr:MAG: hypothetical protein FXF54_02765 [Kosmotoga sp.]
MAKFFTNRCFWDVDTKKLDLEKNKEFIISRVLEHGILKDVHELKKVYSTQEIREVVKKSKNISDKTATFWANVLHIPIEEVNVCSKQKQFLKKFWRF